MNLFGKKENKEIKETSEIKSLASEMTPPNLGIGNPAEQTPMPPSPPPINNTGPEGLNKQPQNMQNQNNLDAPPIPNMGNNENFVNPFSQEINGHMNDQNIGNPNTISNNQPSENFPNLNSQNSMPPMPEQQIQSPPLNDIQAENPQMQVDMDEIQEKIDETVEKIIDERWDELTNNVEKVIKWKGKVEQEIDLIKQDMAHLKEGIEKFEKRLLDKLSNYDTNILDVNSEIKALEKVFQKITPTLVNNVQELSRIAEDLKSVKKPEDEEK